MRIEREEDIPDRMVSRRANRLLYPRDQQDVRSLAEAVSLALNYLEQVPARPPPIP